MRHELRRWAIPAFLVLGGAAGGFVGGVYFAAERMGDAVVMRSPLGRCLAYDPHKQKTYDYGWPRSDGRCHLADWRIWR